ncbi:MAG TPA: hypothetical protein PLV17_06440 [Spirochaetota bacterium]|nr:hypothetical protein [Spirochaetota bacterium]
MKIIIFLICLNPIFGSTYLLAQNVFSQDYIKEVKANGQLLFLKELDRYNLNDQTKILSHAVNLKNQISLQDGYYAVISGEIEPIINHILLIIDGKVWLDYKYSYSEKNRKKIIGISIECANRLHAAISILDNNDYDIAYYCFTGSNIVREIFYSKTQNNLTKIIGYRMPNLKNISYEITMQYGFYKQAIYYNDNYQIIGDWGDTSISPLPNDFFINLSGWFSNPNFVEKYIITKFYPIKSNIFLPEEIKIYKEGRTAYTVHCEYDEVIRENLPIIKKMTISSVDSLKRIIFNKVGKYDTYDVFFLEMEKTQKIKEIADISYDEIRTSILKHLEK